MALEANARLPLLCRIGLHRWAFIHGFFNRYYECRRCEARMVEKGRSGYQPIDDAWLRHREPPERALPMSGSGVMGL